MYMYVDASKTKWLYGILHTYISQHLQPTLARTCNVSYAYTNRVHIWVSLCVECIAASHHRSIDRSIGETDGAEVGAASIADDAYVTIDRPANQISFLCEERRWSRDSKLQWKIKKKQ